MSTRATVVDATQTFEPTRHNPHSECSRIDHSTKPEPVAKQTQQTTFSPSQGDHTRRSARKSSPRTTSLLHEINDDTASLDATDARPARHAKASGEDRDMARSPHRPIDSSSVRFGLASRVRRNVLGRLSTVQLLRSNGQPVDSGQLGPPRPRLLVPPLHTAEWRCHRRHWSG